MPMNFSAIYDGSDASIADFPYHVTILRKGHNWCQGAILSKSWIVTTGLDCVKIRDSWIETDDDDFVVQAGTDAMRKNGSVHQIEKIISHPGYNDSWLYHSNIIPVTVNNIVLIRVKEPFKFDRTRQPVELLKEKPTPGTLANLTGFGEIKGYKSPENLQFIEIPVIELHKCNQTYEGYPGKFPRQGFICAGFDDKEHEKGGHNACWGDVGGPLVVRGRLAGLVSAIRRCTRPRNPVMYTDIGFYREWIDQYIRETKSTR